MNKKLIGGILVVTSMFNFNVYGANQQMTSESYPAEITQNNTQAVEKEGMTVTIDEAIEKGLENSMAMEKVKNQAALASLISENADKSERDINDATQQMQYATSDLSQGRSTVYTSMAQLESAQAALDNGMAPMDIPIPTPKGVLIIPQGQDIAAFLDKYGMAGAAPDVKKKVQKQLDDNKAKLNNALEQLDESTQDYVSGKSKYDLSIQFAMLGVANKLSTNTISSLDPGELGELLVKMANIQDQTTSYSVNIFKNKIVLLIQNNYYEALRQQKLLAVKDKAVERAKLQYDCAQYAYEIGAKSKDDMMFAKLYCDATVMAAQLQLKEYHNAMTELKRSMAISLDTKIKLVPVEASVKKDFDLVQGVDSGLKTRLEIKMAQAKVDIYEGLKHAVDRSNYKESDNQYKEAKLLGDQAQIELKETRLQVESDIRKSYETVMTMATVLDTAKDLEKNAQDSVEIAQLKYEVGFGASNVQLKNLNLEDLSGTMAEVIAAEENLATVQEKVIEAINGYNLAQAKYLNDIGILPYK